MKKTKIKPLLLIAAIALSFIAKAEAKVVEGKKMRDMIQKADKETLVVFDIDNTLIEPSHMLGSSQWYHYEHQKAMNEGLSSKDANERIFPIWVDVLKHTTMVPVEDATPGAIFAAQRKGIKMVALTARPTSIKDITIDELKMAGIDLSLTSPARAPMKMDAIYNDSGFYKGVIFSDLDNDKGLILKEFLAKNSQRPKKVIFIDDVRENVDSVDKAMSENGIECLCVRYGAADKNVRRFDPKIANIQLENLEQNLSDDDAKKMSKKKKQQN